MNVLLMQASQQSCGCYDLQHSLDDKTGKFREGEGLSQGHGPGGGDSH